MGGGVTISGGEPLVKMEFTRGLFRAAKEMRLHTALDTSGYLGHRCDDGYLHLVDLVLLDIKSGAPKPIAVLPARSLNRRCEMAEKRQQPLAQIGTNGRHGSARAIGSSRDERPQWVGLRGPAFE
jgi:pyruvate-formate lyase-activating enzyme